MISRFISESLIRESFLRLRQTDPQGKKGLERTTALFCFLAFDALLKRTGKNPPISLDPESSEGRNNRETLTSEFACLTQLKGGSNPLSMLNLGEVTFGGSSPELRFSANFLTVPVKKSTTSITVYNYPNRPRNPLLVLGPKATGYKWGIDRHSQWSVNLPIFLQGRFSKTPFFDLACVILRQRKLTVESKDIFDNIIFGLSECFTPDLCDFWKKRLSLERVYGTRHANPLQNDSPAPFADTSWVVNNKPVSSDHNLKTRIKYLEGLLRIHNIPFDI